MTQADRVHSTPPTNTSPTRRAFINTIAALPIVAAAPAAVAQTSDAEWRAGPVLHQARPPWLCPNGNPDEGEKRRAQRFEVRSGSTATVRGSPRHGRFTQIATKLRISLEVRSVPNSEVVA
jgi:hypothetical protein